MSSPYHAGRVGDGVREKSGRGGVVRSGRSMFDSGLAHAWLGPASPGEVLACIRAPVGWSASPSKPSDVRARILGGPLGG